MFLWDCISNMRPVSRGLDTPAVNLTFLVVFTNLRIVLILPMTF